MSNNQLIDISKVYLEQIAETDQTEAYTVTAADKKGNTPAWKAYQKGKKNVKTGEPLYKAADHLKNEDKDWGYDKKGQSLNPADIEKRKRKEDKLFGSPKSHNKSTSQGQRMGGKSTIYKESNWRDDLKGLIEIVAEPEEKAEKEIKEKSNIKNKVIINPKLGEAIEEMGGELLSEKDKDTPDQVKAVIAYDKARKGTRDAVYDTEHGDKKQAKKERDYAKWQRDKGAEDAQKSGHPWKHAKYSTREKEGKKSEKHAHIKDSYDRESQLWDEVSERLTELHEIGGVQFKVVPLEEGQLKQELKDLKKGAKTLKGKYVAKADEVEEDKDWIQGAVKRPGAFTKKAKAAGMSVQQFAKHVDDNKSKYSTRTERQANLAQTFAKIRKEQAEKKSL